MKVIQNARENFSGDAMLSKQVWRVEESLKNEGWRGMLET